MTARSPCSTARRTRSTRSPCPASASTASPHSTPARSRPSTRSSPGSPSCRSTSTSPGAIPGTAGDVPELQRHRLAQARRRPARRRAVGLGRVQRGAARDLGLLDPRSVDARARADGQRHQLWPGGLTATSTSRRRQTPPSSTSRCRQSRLPTTDAKQSPVTGLSDSPGAGQLHDRRAGVCRRPAVAPGPPGGLEGGEGGAGDLRQGPGRHRRAGAPGG